MMDNGSTKKGKASNPVLLSLSGGADSVFLSEQALKEGKAAVIVHYDHRARGKESEKDREFVESFAGRHGVRVVIGKATSRTKHEVRFTPLKSTAIPGFEEEARKARIAFLKQVAKTLDAKKILLGHTADDQVETVLMRVFEGAGIAGLKGIPRRTTEGVERPILDVWREDILKYLKRHKIPYRVDKSNFDTRFERNWIRHVLVPLLEERYGKSVKKRLLRLGERFREIDHFLEATARKWAGRNIREEAKRWEDKDGMAGYVFRRKTFGKLPSELRIRILQILCFEKAQAAPNERLLASMDRLILSGGPSASLAIGKGATLSCSYGDARLLFEGGGEERRSWKPVRMTGDGTYELPGATIRWERKQGRTTASVLRKRSAGERTALFDAGELRLPLTARPMRAGDRVRPFGMDAEKKVKEILIDRKVPREERWGRPVVCDAKGAILWIPGVVRSASAPVTPRTRRMIRLGISGRHA